MRFRMSVSALETAAMGAWALAMIALAVWLVSEVAR